MPRRRGPLSLPHCPHHNHIPTRTRHTSSPCRLPAIPRVRHCLEARLQSSTVGVSSRSSLLSASCRCSSQHWHVPGAVSQGCCPHHLCTPPARRGFYPQTFDAIVDGVVLRSALMHRGTEADSGAAWQAANDARCSASRCAAWPCAQPCLPSAHPAASSGRMTAWPRGRWRWAWASCWMPTSIGEGAVAAGEQPCGAHVTQAWVRWGCAGSTMFRDPLHCHPCRRLLALPHLLTPSRPALQLPDRLPGQPSGGACAVRARRGQGADAAAAGRAGRQVGWASVRPELAQQRRAALVRRGDRTGRGAPLLRPRQSAKA